LQVIKIFPHSFPISPGDHRTLIQIENLMIFQNLARYAFFSIELFIIESKRKIIFEMMDEIIPNLRLFVKG